MKSKLFLLALLILASNTIAFGQLFNEVYPISDNPNINYKTSYTKQETILFEANPVVRFSFYNNMLARLKTDKPCGTAVYLYYKPELRMYTDNSLPVKMPSQRIFLGAQEFFRIHHNNILTFLVETGHYSNGAYESAFSTFYPDGSKQSDSVISKINYKTNLSNIVNRVSGEFSTDLTQFTANYRLNWGLNRNYIPVNSLSFELGSILYDDGFIFGLIPIGGYADNLIDIYGRWRHHAQIEYVHIIKDNRISFSEYLEYIAGERYASVNPCRSVTTASFFFKNNFGFFASFIAGHDDYNLRFVDSGTQVSLGLAWNVFPPPQLRTQPLGM